MNHIKDPQTDRASRLQALLRKKKQDAPGASQTEKTSAAVPMAAPVVGELQPVAAGIYGLRLPNFSVLDHVNVWLLRGNQGWIIVDTGAAREPIRAIWKDLLSRLPDTSPIEAIVITHIHDDHFGNAGWLQAETNAPVYMTPLEWGFVQNARAWDLKKTEELWYQYFALVGLDREAVRAAGLHRLDYLDASPFPERVEPLLPDQVFEGPDRNWKVAIHPGHTAAHAMLLDSREELLVAADHGLKDYPIGLGPSPVDPHHDLLTGFQEALQVLQNAGDQTLILPGHGTPWRGTKGFAAELTRRMMARQQSALHFFDASCSIPAYQWCAPLIERASSSHQQYLIYADAIGHLAHLVATDKLSRTFDDQGLAHYFIASDPK